MKIIRYLELKEVDMTALQCEKEVMI